MAPVPTPGGGTAATSATFFDPMLAELQRQLQHSLTTGTADLNLNKSRVLEDAELLRPFMARRFEQQLARKAADVAGRGFAGEESGIMRSGLGDLAEDQAFASGQFEKGVSRDVTDIDRAIAALTARTTMGGAEGVRAGAGRSADRAIRNLPF